MNLYYVNLNILNKKTNEFDNTNFAIPAETGEEALEKSKDYAEGGVLLEKFFPMSKYWN